MALSTSHRASWLARVNADREFALISRWTHVQFALRCGADTYRFKITPQRIEAIDAFAPDMPSFALHGTSAAWEDFSAPMPASPNHHVLGMDRRRDDFSIAEGRHHFIQHLRVMTVALALMRGHQNEVNHG